MDKIHKLFELIKQKHAIDQTKEWSEGSSTYFHELRTEIDEVAEELKSGKQVYLEDELGDILWDYLNLLYNLEYEKKIVLERVFERSLKKYSERVEGIQEGRSWSDIKKNQKDRLKEEHFERNSKK